MEEGAPVALQNDVSARTEELRTGVIGTGFIGRVHARSALLAGGRIAGVAASSAERSAAGGRGACVRKPASRRPRT